jgi:hypothetical protein
MNGYRQKVDRLAGQTHRRGAGAVREAAPRRWDWILAAAIGVALMAALTAWQWTKRQAAREELRRFQTQLTAAREEGLAARSKLEKLRATAQRLEQELADANQLSAWAAATTSQFEAWKRETRRELTAPDYRWSDNSAFARIPKAVLPELSEATPNNPFSPPGIVNPYAHELLGLTAAERQAMDATLRSVAELQRGPKAEVYDWVRPASGRVLASRAFTTEPPGEVGVEAEQRLAQMLTDLRGVLGDDRWSGMPSRVTRIDCETLNRMLIPAPTTPITAWVELDDQGIPNARWTFVGDISVPGGSPAPAPGSGRVYSVNVVGYVNGKAALSAFLPGGEASQTTDVASRVGSYASEAVRQHATSWLEELARARLGRME